MAARDQSERQRYRPRARWVAVTLGAVMLLAAAGYVGWQAMATPAAAPGRPPVTVTAARAEAQTWRTRLPAVGTLDAVNGIEVTTEVPGIVGAIMFESGQSVARGEPLVQLEDAQERAELQRLQAELEQAQSVLNRDSRLRGEQFVPEEVFEQSRTDVSSLEAQVAAQEALLDKKAIRAPFSGELGIRRVDLGEYVPAGQPLVVLEQIAPILVDFSLPEQHYGRIAEGSAIELRVAAWPDRVFAGTVTAVSPLIQTETRNFRAQGTLANEDQALRPGMFAQVVVLLDDRREVVALPATAVSYNPYGDAVYLVAPPEADSRQPRPETERGWWPAILASVRDLLGGGEPAQAQKARDGPPPLVARRSFVTVGERRETWVEIVKGVRPGDLVVTAGQIKLDDEAPVVVSDEEVGATAARTSDPES